MPERVTCYTNENPVAQICPLQRYKKCVLSLFWVSPLACMLRGESLTSWRNTNPHAVAVMAVSVVFVSEGLLVDSYSFCFTVTHPMHLKSKIKQCPMVWTALGDTGTKLPTQQKIPTLRYRCSDLPPFCLWTLKVSLKFVSL